MSGWDDDEAIGYGKPPRYTRFRKGQSGNPKGRPRKQKHADADIPAADLPSSSEYIDVLRSIYAERVTIKTKGKPKQISLFEAIARRQAKDAAEGSVTAQREVTRAKEKLDALDAERKFALEKAKQRQMLESQEDQRKVYNYLVDLHKKQTEVYRIAEETGFEPIPRYPHPEDFVFDHTAGKARVAGPWGEESAFHYSRIAKQREYHFLDLLILSRQRPSGSKFLQNLAMIQTAYMDCMLPRRQRMTSKHTDTAMVLLCSRPLRELRKRRDELKHWLACNPLPQLSKKQRKEVYQITNRIMQPLLRPLGFRSVAELEKHCEAQERQG